MSEAWRSVSLNKSYRFIYKIYIASNTKTDIPSATRQICCTMMVDELGFKVGFPKRTKVNRWRRGVLKLSVD